MSHGLAIKKPTQRECKICMDMAESCGVMPDCFPCFREEPVEILQFVSSFWGSYAICKNKDNQFVKVDTSCLKAIDSCPMCGTILEK